MQKNKACRHCPASKTHAETERPSRLESPALEGICVIVRHRPLCQMASRWREPHPYLSKCHHIGWLQGALNPSRGRRQFATIQLQLQIFSSTRGFEAIQIWWLLRSSWRGGELRDELFIGMRCLLTVCVSICWYGEQTLLDFFFYSLFFFLRRATLEAWLAYQLSDIIPQFHGILNSQTIGREERKVWIQLTTCFCWDELENTFWCIASSFFSTFTARKDTFDCCMKKTKNRAFCVSHGS